MNQQQSTLGLKGKTTLLLGGLIFVLLLLLSFSSYWLSREVSERQVIELEQSHLELFKYQIEAALNNHQRNLMSLHDVPPIQAILRATANKGIDPQNSNSLKQWRDRLKIIFSAFMANHPEYQQIRYINAEGGEIVRVESAADKPRIVPDNQLQNKSDRAYVIETLLLNEGEVYYSDVSLNKEFGEIQVPHLPVLRMATPVYNEKGIVSALLIINLATEQMFNAVTSEVDGVQRSIVDQKGYYIKHDQPAKMFGFELGKDERLENDYPMLALLSRRYDHYMEHNNRLEQLVGFQKIHFSPTDPDRYWLLTLTIPEDLVFAEITRSLNRMLIISLLIGLMALYLIIMYTSRKLLKPVVTLAKAARSLQEGDLSIRVDTSTTHDEFYTLSLAINAFAENQQQYTQDLKAQVAIQTQRLTAVIDNVVDGIMTLDGRGRIESMNQSTERIFGYQTEELLGRNISVLMSESYHSEDDNYLSNLVNSSVTEMIEIGREASGCRKDGSVFPMKLFISKMIIEDSLHFVCITRDITERKHSEQIQKEFISMVSHELRTPLTSIRGSLGLILGKFNDNLPANVTAMLDIANNNSERLIHLINDILDIDKIEAGKMHFDNQVTDISSIVSLSIDNNKAYAEKFNVEFVKANGFDSGISVYVDPHRITQVMSNLLSNAAKFSPEHAQVKITIERIADHVKISVHNNGHAIPEEFQSRLFVKFAQADSSDTRKKGGTGLGLNISKSILENQGGHIYFDSKPQTGTTFSFTLPIYQPSPVKQINNPVITRQTRILLVEENPDIALPLQQELSRNGCISHHVVSYEEAIDLIKTQQFDAITVNLSNNIEEGLTLIREISAIDNNQSIPVIAITNDSENVNSVVDISTMNIHWIDDPFDHDKLTDSVYQALASQLASRRRILHVEDDGDICQIVDGLLGDKYPIDHAVSVAYARQLLRNNLYHLVILDIELPDGSGLDLLATINTIEPRIPVIIFSAQDASDINIEVQQVLVKSLTNNEQLVQAIKNAITAYNEQTRAQA